MTLSEGGCEGGREGWFDTYLDSRHLDVLRAKGLYDVESVLFAVVLESDGGLRKGRKRGREGRKGG